MYQLHIQLIFVHIHQLFRVLYTTFLLDTVNIYWWWCITLCRVAPEDRTRGDGCPPSRPPSRPKPYMHIYIYIYIHVYVFMYIHIYIHT